MDWNRTRYRPGQQNGHYESFFQRANHPTRPLAFWIRYTLFSPHRDPAAAIGELWAIYFDGERQSHVAAKTEISFGECRFDNERFAVRIADATLDSSGLHGSAHTNPSRIAWDLRLHGDATPLLLLPANLYDASLPKAKSVVGLPLARYTGTLMVNDQTITIDDWVGSQNHNWGSRHTDWYCWGQVAGFDGHPDTFLEVATARLRFGPLWTPPLTPVVLRHRGRELRLNRIRQCLRAKIQFRYFDWAFASEADGLQVSGRLTAPHTAFVGLRYYNPPGGTKQCLNSKIAACQLTITERGTSETLISSSRAAFEVLTDDTGHDVAIRV